MADEHWDRVVALAKVSMVNPIAAAVLRLHSDEHATGSCAECTAESSVPWPCPTVRTIEAAAAEQEQAGRDCVAKLVDLFRMPTSTAHIVPPEATDG